MVRMSCELESKLSLKNGGQRLSFGSQISQILTPSCERLNLSIMRRSQPQIRVKLGDLLELVKAWHWRKSLSYRVVARV